VRIPRALVHVAILASIAVGAWAGYQLFWLLAGG
jgi:hypothetical protein